MANNTFDTCHVGVFVGGGRRHHVTGNHFSNCTYATHIDDRGLTWQTQYCMPPNGIFFQQLEALNYKQPPYSTRYPELVNIANDHPCVPVYNQLVNNTYCSLISGFIDASSADTDKWLDVVKDNVEKC